MTLTDTEIERRAKLLGRRKAPDPNDHGYLMRARTPRRVPQKSRAYSIGSILNQGFTSSCVGQGCRQWLSSSLMKTKTGPDALTIYREAQKIDEWPGEEPEYEGTSVRAGFKVLQALGHVASYVWAWDEKTIRDYMLSGLGVVVVGTSWYEAMFEPDKKGYLQIGGDVIGGHCYVLGAVSLERQAYRMIQSWGPEWGQNGRAWITFKSVQRLFSEPDPEGCAATEQKVQPVTTS